MTADEWEAKKDVELEREMEQLEKEDDAQRREAWAEMEATEKQIAYAASLGVTLRKNATMLEASEAIDAVLARPDSITDRQRMALRFWGKDAPSAWGRKQVSDWMDAWYAGDWRRKNEWEKFKAEAGISTKEKNFMLVPWNEGNRRLYPITSVPKAERATQGWESAKPSNDPRATFGAVILGVVALVVIVFAVALSTIK